MSAISTPTMTRPGWPARLVEWLLVAVLLAGVYGAQLERVEFHPDESQWIATSGVFEAYFTGQLSSPLWAESYWTLTQPPLTRYVIGAGRRLAGYTPRQLNGPWSYYADGRYHEQGNAVPSYGLLHASRVPMCLLTLGVLLAVFGWLRAVAGRPAAYAWVGLCVLSTYLPTMLVRAMGEAPLMAAVVLVGWAATRLLQAVSDTRADATAAGPGLVRWVVLLGVGTGLAGSAKLNGLAAGGAGVMLVALAASHWPGARGARWLFFGGGSALLVACAAVVFVGLNPFLWPAPVARTRQMLDHRLQEVHYQATHYPANQVSSLRKRCRVVSERVLGTYAAVQVPEWAGGLQMGLGLNAMLQLSGLTWLLGRARRWFAGNRQGAGPLAVLLVGLTVAAPTWLVPLDWDRYYLLPVGFDTLITAMALGAAASALAKWGRRRGSAPAQNPPLPRAAA